MDRVQKAISLNRQIEEFKHTISTSYSDWEINRAIELLEIRADELATLEKSLTEEEESELEHYYLMESHPLAEN